MFKVGDKVLSLITGDTGTVVEIDSSRWPYEVALDNSMFLMDMGGGSIPHAEDELELI